MGWGGYFINIKLSKKKLAKHDFRQADTNAKKGSEFAFRF